MENEPQILDGFTYSLSQVLLPISFRAAAQAQLETLRLASNYQFKAYVVPTPENPSPGGTIDNNQYGYIPAFSQVEQQLSIDPGTYIYGWMFGTNDAGDELDFHVNVTDACTESPLSSDYILGSLLSFFFGDVQQIFRGPCFFSQPRLISDPGLVNVEIYNNNDTAISAQLVLYCAAPRPQPSPYATMPTNTGWHPGAKRGPQY